MSGKRKRDDSPPSEGGQCIRLCNGPSQQQRQIDLWRTSTFCDCEVAVEGEVFVGHRLVLSTSDFLAACFQSGMAETSGRVEIQDMRAEVFRLVLEYMYTGMADVGNSISLLEILEAAARLQYDGLLTETARLLIDDKDALARDVWSIWSAAYVSALEQSSFVSKRSVSFLFTLAVLHRRQLALPSLVSLRQSCRDYALENFRKLDCASASFDQMKILLSVGDLFASEEDIFSSLMAWARAQEEHAGEASSSSRLHELLKRIRFKLMSPDFINTVVRADPLMAPHTDILLDALLKQPYPRGLYEGDEIGANEYQLTYEWIIPDFSNIPTGEPLETGFSDRTSYRMSPIFRLGDECWQLTINKGGGKANMLSVFLRCHSAVGEKTIPVECDLTVVNTVSGRRSIKQVIGDHTFGMMSTKWCGSDWGFNEFCALTDINDNFLVNDQLRVKVDIVRKSE